MKVLSSQLFLVILYIEGCTLHSNGFHSRYCLKVSTFFQHHVLSLGVTWSERSAHKEENTLVPSGHTSGTPSPCCPEGKPGESSATLRCSGSGRHGCTFPRPQCTPHWWQRPGWPDTRCRGP